MLLIDGRVGSKDLLEPLRSLGLAAELVQLTYGDIAFESKDGLNIGIERKRLSDLIGSLRDGRLSGHQLPGLIKAYDYTWLIVEGEYKVNRAGQVVEMSWHGRKKMWAPIPGGMYAAEMEGRLLTLELCGGLHVRFTRDRDDTCRFLSHLYHWWVDRALDQHTSHLTEHTAHGFIPLSSFRTAIKQWPGVGLRVSLAAEEKFRGSVRRAANATIDDWATITTSDKHGKARRFGSKNAERVVQFLKGE
jgi:ERCC4-type nuclease